MQNPIVTFTMQGGGVFKAELYPEKAPNTVNTFLSLVKSGFYDGLTFHRVIEGFMIQGSVRKRKKIGLRARKHFRAKNFGKSKNRCGACATVSV